MTKTKFVFSYTEIQDFEEPLEITMEVPVRSIDEMCEYFQRFLIASGWVFDEGEQIKLVNKGSSGWEGAGCGGDVITFDGNGSPFVYNFGDNNNPFFGGVSPYSGVRGGMAEDIIKIDNDTAFFS